MFAYSENFDLEDVSCLGLEHQMWIKPLSETSKRMHARQVVGSRVTCVAGALSALVTGTIQGWTAPALPYLLHENLPKLDNENITTISQTPGITIQQASIIGAIAALGGLVGALPAGPLADALGRKKLLLLLTFPFFVGWIIIPAAPESVS
uniref:Major facilitator superfamily (MFS) profile domain-containing protein n=1 Tax=Timema monikensis TaxID=170555 RepID=A0A7R9EGG8_9NEOP|nr:unnamed protein product [Timema monikensis]